MSAPLCLHSQRRALRRVLRLVHALVVTLLLFAACPPIDSWAKDKAATAHQTLPDPLTKESIRDLVSRLSDDEVRKLLLDQLDKAAAPPKPTKPPEPQGVVEVLRTQGDEVRARTASILGAAPELPAAFASVSGKLAADGNGLAVAPAFGVLALLLVIGWLAERLYLRLLQGVRGRLAVPRPGLVATATGFALRLAIALGGIAVFALVVIGLFFALWQGNEVRRTFVLATIAAIVIVRGTIVVTRFLLAPGDAAARLLPFDDGTARTLHNTVVAIAALYAVHEVARASLIAAEVEPPARALVALIVAVLSVAILIRAIWKVRPALNALFRSGREKTGPLMGMLVDLWPLAATLYVLGIFVARFLELVTGQAAASGQGILSLLLLIALPVIDWAFCRALALTAEAQRNASPEHPGLVASYESVLRRALHIVVTIFGLLALAALWDIDLFALAQRGLGARIAGSLTGIVIVVLLALMGWEVTKTAIDRRLAAEGDSAGAVSRVRTLLPILRVLLQVTIVVMAVMSILAALGVDILPLLAGASVVGVAIGFGSQTLVRDIVSGAFFLMDDAFRIGEYIEVGDAKGTIEKITVRSLFLRHHRGALNVLPYGEIKRLRNTSRDWIIIVMEFRLAFDTDLKKVKKLVQRIGEELSADPEYGSQILQPLKSQGVISTDESSLVVRCKYMAKPGGEVFVIRRMAYERILKAFNEAGIRFASRQVSVYVPPGAEGADVKQAASLAASAAAALDATGRAAA